MIKFNITKPDGLKPIIATFFGEGGVGKTELASLFPNPIFIRTEDGTESLIGKDVYQLPIVKNSDEVVDQIKFLGEEDHNYKTLVIDSITKLNQILMDEIIKIDGKSTSINTALGGYGAGYSALSNKHLKIKTFCNKLSEIKNMNIIFIGHSSIETLSLPDYATYNRYTINIHEKSLTHYVDDVGLVAFIKLKRSVVSSSDEDRTRVRSSGERLVTCHYNASQISKNRYGIDQDLIYNQGENPFLVNDRIKTIIESQTKQNKTKQKETTKTETITETKEV